MGAPSEAGVYEGVQEVFGAVFPDVRITVDASVTAAEVPGWDSMAHVELILAVEEKFGIRFEPEEIIMFKSVGELVSLIRQKCA